MSNQTIAPSPIAELDEATQKAYTQRCRERYETTRNTIAEAVAANKHLLQAGDGPWACPGYVSFSGANSEIHGKFLYPPGPTQGYVTMEGAGPGLVQGKFEGIATFAVNRNELVGLGEVTCLLNTKGTVLGLLLIEWWKGNKYVGSFAGRGFAVASGIVLGTCTFHLG